MRVTQEPLLKRFWYCVMPMAGLGEKPVGMRLLGEAIALWKDDTRASARGADAVSTGPQSFRLALLVENGNIVRPYHGWAYDGGETASRSRRKSSRNRTPSESQGPIAVAPSATITFGSRSTSRPSISRRSREFLASRAIAR